MRAASAALEEGTLHSESLPPVLRVHFHREGAVGESVADVFCRLRDESSSWSATATSDAFGDVRFECAAPGAFVLDTTFAEALALTVRAGGETRVAVVVPQALWIMGRVFDADGKPRQGAEICSGLRADPNVAHVVAWSDAQGRFQVASLDTPAYVFARAPERSRSNAIFVDADRAQGELVLRFGFAEVWAGVVIGRGGEPVVGAEVIVGADSQLTGPERNGFSTGTLDTAWRTRTDESGRFLVAGVEAGAAREVTVLAESYGATTLESVRGRDDLRIDMAEERVLRGVVASVDGQPLSEAFVAWGRPGTFARAAAATDERGRFELRGVPARSLVELRVFREGFRTRTVELEATALSSEIQVVLSRAQSDRAARSE